MLPTASPTSLCSLNTRGPGTKPSLFFVQKHYLCGLSAQITLLVWFYKWGDGDGWRRRCRFITSVWREEEDDVSGLASRYSDVSKN